MTVLALAAVDDGYYNSGAAFLHTADNEMRMGNVNPNVYEPFLRFALGVSLAYVEIDSGYLSQYGIALVGTTPRAVIKFELAAAPAAPTSVANFLAKVLTGSVAWEPTSWGAEFNDSPDVAAILNSVLDAHPQATHFQAVIKVTQAVGTHYTRSETRELSLANAGTLTLSYTVASGALLLLGVE